MDDQVVWQCGNPECRFRFPSRRGDPALGFCPRCGGSELSDAGSWPPQRVGMSSGRHSGLVLNALLDCIRSAYNTGSMFRTADGAGIRRMYLCGLTPQPYLPQVSKTALGAEQAVPWVYFENAVNAAETILRGGGRLWALEGGQQAESIYDVVAGARTPSTPLTLVVGNEVSGVDPALLEMCERRICIPMAGVKDSLNVAVAFGIAAYYLRSPA